MTVSFRRIGVTMVTVALLGMLGACGGDDDPESNPAPPAATGTASSPAHEPGATAVNVTMNEFSFRFPKTEIAPGAYTFHLMNSGSAPHAMSIKGPGVDAKASPTVGGSESTSLSVTLQAGTYEVWCPVGNHRAQGMVTTLTVK